MAVRNLGNGRYAVEFESRGNRVFRRLPAGATKTQARDLETKLRRELIDQAVLGKTPTVPLDWAIGQWFEEVVKGRKDEDPTKSKVGLVKAAVADLHLTRGGVTEAAERVRKMARKREGKALEVATINRRLSIIKGTAKWAWKVKHWTPENLSPYVILIDKKKERVRREKLTQAQVEKLIRIAPNFETKAFIAFACYGLMRQGEIMRARPEHALRGGLKLPDTKAGAPRVVPVLPELRPFLAALPLQHHKRTLYGWYQDACRACGIGGKVHHDLRRSGATILLNRGVALEVVAHIMGNSLEVARTVYAEVLDRTAARAMRKGFRPIKNPSGRKRLGASA